MITDYLKYIVDNKYLLFADITKEQKTLIMKSMLRDKIIKYIFIWMKYTLGLEMQSWNQTILIYKQRSTSVLTAENGRIGGMQWNIYKVHSTTRLEI